MKMAVFFIENAFCVGLFQSFYDGGDLDENGCFLYRKCVLRWTFSIILRWGRLHTAGNLANNDNPGFADLLHLTEPVR